MIKKNYHHGNLKEEFLSISFEFIASYNIDKLTLKFLSDKTGTSRSAIYRHFKSKDELIKEIIKRGFDLFDESITKSLKNKNISILDRFYLAGKAYVTWAIQNQNLYKLLFGIEYSDIRENIINIKTNKNKTFYEFKKLVRVGQRLGIMKDENAYKQTIIVWSSIHGLCRLVIDGFVDIQEIYKDLYNDMFKSLLNGLISNKIKLISSIPFSKDILSPSKKYDIKQEG